ncbi:uncharacterized protein BJ171DRAFT_177092 [Polychytrium aggregatum]|uniref:uncharacterized protein n=1 Tax=Polychytrium aggregatum TaxID=110093 RepID=UPI0022FEDD3B|nr:uncharacterized protein BJ171DRAFT_177092 [Polychytrium aggregatum]KAI9202557.1 hypothetical protein BJ171DRAFT_177092 [Polychytrium aggregatum]
MLFKSCAAALVLGLSLTTGALAKGDFSEYISNLDHRIGSISEQLSSDATAAYTAHTDLLEDGSFQGWVKQVKDHIDGQSSFGAADDSENAHEDNVQSLVQTVFGQSLSGDDADKQRQAVLTAVLPTSFDARQKGWVKNIKNQANCGSCVAFSTAEVIEVALATTGVSADVSEADLFFCLGASAGASCATGWYPHDAIAKVAAQGFADESCFPYTPRDTPCRRGCARHTGFKQVNFRSINDIKQHVAVYGSAITAFTVYDDFQQCCRNNAVYHQASNRREGGHAVSIIGWDDSRRAWLCRNHWTTNWGTNGFFWIGYGEAGINSLSKQRVPLPGGRAP